MAPWWWDAQVKPGAKAFRKFLLSLYPREVNNGISQPPASEWRSPTLSSLEKVQPNTGNWAPRVHWATSGLLPNFLWEFWVTGFWDGEPAIPGSIGSFCRRAVPGYLSSPTTSSIDPIDLYSRAHHSQNLPCTCLTLNTLHPYLDIPTQQKVCCYMFLTNTSSALPSWKLHVQTESPSFPHYRTYYRTSNVVGNVLIDLLLNAGKSRWQEPFLNFPLTSSPVPSAHLLNLERKTPTTQSHFFPLPFCCCSSFTSSALPYQPFVVNASCSSSKKPWDDLAQIDTLWTNLPNSSSLQFCTLSYILLVPFHLCISWPPNKR